MARQKGAGQRDAVADHDFSATLENAKGVAKSTASRAAEVSRAAAGKAAEVSGSAIEMASDAISNSTRVTEALGHATEVVKAATESARQAAAETFELAVDANGKAYQAAADGVRNFDYGQLRQIDFYAEKFTHYKDLSVAKVSETLRSTFEVDKSTMEMVADVRGRLPVPAKTVDDIFEQCKREAIRRAVLSFGLGGAIGHAESYQPKKDEVFGSATPFDALAKVDIRSEAKYENLSESYKQNKDAVNYAGTSHQNYAAMSQARDALHELGTLENGYNKDAPLFKRDAQVEHVISRKEIYQDPLLRVGTTGKEMADIMNDQENLLWADGAFNGSKGEHNLMAIVEKGRVDPDSPDKIIYTIERSGREVELGRDEVEEAYARATAKRNEHRLTAAKEVASTMISSGAHMAAQQVVGLIVVETIDIFVDEIKNLASNGSVMSENGWLQNTADAKDRIQSRLAERFEERQIWARARALGLEAGVAGALSVIPQILLSMIVKTPAFVLAIIRESTLSVVRCVRILASDDADKLESMKVILAVTASAIVGVYVGRVIGSAIAGAPLLNRFNSQVTGVLTGLVVTAVPLVAIYTFERNKEKLSFSLSKVRAAIPF